MDLYTQREMRAALIGNQMDMLNSARGQEFRVIPGYENYMINCDGSYIRHVISDEDKRGVRKLFLSRTFHKDKGKDYPDGYWYATMVWHGSDFRCQPRPVAIHRLVALAWVENDEPINKVWVNHEDGNKLNCYYLNLKWGTISYNIQHAHDTGLWTIGKGKDHPMFGYKHTDATKKALSKAKRGENHPKFKGYYITPAGRFTSIGAAVEANGSYTRQVKQYCETNSPGWSFEPKKAKRKYTKLSRIVSK